MIRLILYFTLTMLITVSVGQAQDVSLRDDHPEQYVVVKGDTLWDIAGRFLDEPWQWPAIWQANSQIDNPHLIYPGDVVSLVYIDGRPVLQVVREGDAPVAPAAAPPDRSGKQTVKLSPQIRYVDRSDPINAIPLDAIEPFLRDIRVLSPSEFAGLPYIVANEEDRLSATYSDITFARGLNARIGDEFLVVRLVNIYDELGDPPEARRVIPTSHWLHAPAVKNPHDVNRPRTVNWDNPAPWNRKPKNPIGYEVWEVSRVRVKEPGEITVLQVMKDRTEIKTGDFILRADDFAFDSSFLPQAMETVPDDLYVMATTGAKYGVGHYQIVAISGGSNQGLRPGHVFSAYRPGEMVHDRTGYRRGSFEKESYAQLPSIYDGMVMVFRTFADVSYAIVLDGPRLVKEFDTLHHPRHRG